MLRRVVYDSYNTVCPPVREIIHSLKLMDYLLVRRTNRGKLFNNLKKEGRNSNNK